MQAGADDAEEVWDAISTAAVSAEVTGLRDLGRYGLSCEVDAELAIRHRSAMFRTIWHYATCTAAPRLVSAFPRL